MWRLAGLERLLWPVKATSAAAALSEALSRTARYDLLAKSTRTERESSNPAVQCPAAPAAAPGRRETPCDRPFCVMPACACPGLGVIASAFSGVWSWCFREGVCGYEIASRNLERVNPL